MPAAKKLIEVALPLDAINKASAREKSIRHGHPSTLHLWWARRPLATTRAVIFTSLVDDPDDPNANPAFVAACKKLNYGATNEEIAALKEHTEKNRERRLRGQSAIPFKRNIPQNARDGNDSPRMRLFDFIERLVQWKSTTDEAIMGQARELIRIATNGNPPPLLDPFAGGGSIPLEAQRLGLEAHASDLNPVAVMINKAMIEIPPRFANMPPVNPRDRETGTAGDAKWKGAAGLAADVRYYGEWMRERAFEKIGHLYPKHNGETVIAWLWARTVTCPNPACRSTMPLMTTFELSKKTGKRAWLVPHPDPQAKQVRFEVRKGEGKVPKPPKVGRGAKFKCLVCGETAPDQYIKDESIAGRMSTQLTAIVTEGKGGRNYHSPTPEQAQIAESAVPEWKPVQEMNRDTTDLVSGRGYGFYCWSDLFTPRQLTALTTFSDLVHEARELATQDALGAGLADDGVPLRDAGTGARAYGEAVSVYLAFAVDKGADFWSIICSWASNRDTIRNTFARQAIPMVWDFAEGNPLSDSAGNLMSHIKWITGVIDALPKSPSGYGLQSNATALMVTHAYFRPIHLITTTSDTLTFQTFFTYGSARTSETSIPTFSVLCWYPNRKN